jgi:hypothetical protein
MQIEKDVEEGVDEDELLKDEEEEEKEEEKKGRGRRGGKNLEERNKM